MIPIDRLQAYLHHSAQLRYETVELPGFSLFFHRTDSLLYYNYAYLASALTSQAIARAIASGVDLACLTAEDEHAGRVYERLGFRPHATMLAYIDEKQ